MNNGMDREPRNMLDKDDQDWFALLTGQSVPDAATDTVREAQALRRAVLAEHATPADTATDQAGLDRLLFRLQRAGLLTPRRPVWRRPAFVSTVAAAMLAICILPWMLTHEQPPELRPGPAPVQKGIHLPQMLYKADPLAHARALRDALTAVGIPVEHRDEGASQMLIAQLLQPLTAAVREVLQQYRLKAPVDDKLLVEIVLETPTH